MPRQSGGGQPNYQRRFSDAIVNAKAAEFRARSRSGQGYERRHSSRDLQGETAAGSTAVSRRYERWVLTLRRETFTRDHGVVKVPKGYWSPLFLHNADSA